jgi:hypothetical protein
MNSWGGREKKLEELPPGGEKALEASLHAAEGADVPERAVPTQAPR